MTVEDTIVRALATLVAAANPERITLFGSQARGDADAGSDIDLLVAGCMLRVAAIDAAACEALDAAAGIDGPA